MKAIDIKWDTDGDTEIFDNLPSEIEIPEGMTDIYDISDYISDKTGFCHTGFTLDFNGTVICCPECGNEVTIEFDTARCECGWVCADPELEEIVLE